MGTIISTPMMPPTAASVTIWRMLKYSFAPPLAMKRNAGIVNTTPGGDRLAGRADRLDDVVFEDGRAG